MPWWKKAGGNQHIIEKLSDLIWSDLNWSDLFDLIWKIKPPRESQVWPSMVSNSQSLKRLFHSLLRLGFWVSSQCSTNIPKHISSLPLFPRLGASKLPHRQAGDTIHYYYVDSHPLFSIMASPQIIIVFFFNTWANNDHNYNKRHKSKRK